MTVEDEIDVVRLILLIVSVITIVSIGVCSGI